MWLRRSKGSNEQDRLEPGRQLYAFRAKGLPRPERSGMMGWVTVEAHKDIPYSLFLFTVMREGDLVLLAPCTPVDFLLSSEFCSRGYGERVFEKALRVGMAYACGEDPASSSDGIPVRFAPLSEMVPDEPIPDPTAWIVNQLNAHFSIPAKRPK